MSRGSLIAALGLSIATVPQAVAQGQVMAEYQFGTAQDHIVVVNRALVRRAGDWADVLATLKYAQPWNSVGLAANQKWMRIRLHCPSGTHHRAISEKGIHPLTRDGDPEGERLLLATPKLTVPVDSPLVKAMCNPPQAKLSLTAPWPAYGILLSATPDQVVLTNPDVQQFPWAGGMEEAFARARAVYATGQALAGMARWTAYKRVPGVAETGFIPLAQPLTFHENLYKSVVSRGFVDLSSVWQGGDTLYTYNYFTSARTIHTKAGKVQPLHMIVIEVRCGARPQQRSANMVRITPAPQKYQLLPLPHAAMQWSDTVSDFSRALCTRPVRLPGKPLATYPEATQAIMNSLTPLPIGS
ncbi:MAG: hypothetical protein EOP60_07070 [Sphingomonadales bacterium]|nr:MAG: hypothetical protein EOP60_07070 [Sphingomonadales bacterium]